LTVDASPPTNLAVEIGDEGTSDLLLLLLLLALTLCLVDRLKRSGAKHREL
jgi:hypothetical protein